VFGQARAVDSAEAPVFGCCRRLAEAVYPTDCPPCSQPSAIFASSCTGVACVARKRPRVSPPTNRG
jgi:hypothetical protein